MGLYGYSCEKFPQYQLHFTATHLFLGTGLKLTNRKKNKTPEATFFTTIYNKKHSRKKGNKTELNGKNELGQYAISINGIRRLRKIALL